nr:hypothetical protein [Tanacetum cinerariifolium]
KNGKVVVVRGCRGGCGDDGVVAARWCWQPRWWCGGDVEGGDDGGSGVMMVNGGHRGGDVDDLGGGGWLESSQNLVRKRGRHRKIIMRGKRLSVYVRVIKK